MDSLTQAVLGAAVGEVVLGRKIGNKAPLWGAIAGTIPDLDVVLNFFIDEVQSTLWHRTFSHSLFVLTLAAPLFGYFVFFLYRRSSSATFGDWTNLFFWGLITHPLLDACTNYGTMLFYPFSEFRVSWRTIYIIDPLYTLPLLIASVAVLFMTKGNIRRKRTTIFGLALSSAYLGATFFTKLHVSQVVEAGIKEQQITAQKFMTTPAFFNNILWSYVVKSEEGYYVGYYSLLDKDRKIEFSYIPQQKELLLPYLQEAGPISRNVLLELIEFTEYFYAIENTDEGVLLHDLRFGKISGWFEQTQDFIFSFRIFREEDNTKIEQVEPEFNVEKEDFDRLLERTTGN
ncbi:metal-dependent hydrolase [Catalinimonas niigatensis]|uniref:metal-dependent hydrolase n=1 Tax=Catalinimonas niigatensis TaxID=1397264 RepID=UPI0026657E69|nr:metal-dependent hydrolase [Catalinimonas niigatensis]WPP48047.1 metal-dependent hydrolase [Catalinimonas niigatensis]